MPCAYCGLGFRLTPRGRTATRDHVLPKSRFFIPYGTKNSNNVVPACRSCNEEKGDLTPDEWLLVLRQRGDPRVEAVVRVRARFQHLLKAAIFRGKVPTTRDKSHFETYAGTVPGRIRK